MKYLVVPISFRDACSFVNKHHRHNKAPQGCKFCIAITTHDNKIVGVAICGRPLSPKFDSLCIEITRVCVLEGYKNACSFLISKCVKIAREMGYKKVITYTLASENGASLKASNFRLVSEQKKVSRWKSSRIMKNLFGEYEKYPNETRNRYEYVISV